MGNTTLDMQASLNTKGGIDLIMKEQNKSSVGSRHGQSTPFVRLLDQKTVQAINDEPDMEKIKEGPDRETTNSDFTGIPAFVPLPLERGHKLWRGAPLSRIEVIKSLPLTDEAKLAVLSVPTIKTTGNIAGDILKPTMPVSAEMTGQANQARQEDPAVGIVKSTFSRIKKSLPSSDEAKLFDLSTPTENTTESPSESELKQVFSRTADMEGQAGQTLENSTVLKMASLSATEEKFRREMDQSSAISTVGLPGIRARNDVKSAISLTTEVAGHAEQTQTNNTVHEGVSVTLGATVADTPLPGVDSSSDDHVTNHIRSAKSEHRTEAGSMDHVAEALRQKDDKSAADSIFTDLRRTTVSHRDNRTDMAVQKEGGYIATAAQRPIAAVNDRVAAMEQAVSNDFQVELPDRAVFMKSSPAGTTAADQDDQQIWNAVPDRHHRTTNRDEFPLRTEMTNILSTQVNRPSTAEGPAGINTQAVIDQILDAKQSLNNGFGRVRITLDPPNLGTVNLEIVVRMERVEVVITTDNPGVQQALQSRMDDVRTALQRQDLKIENFQVLLQDNTANQQQANSGATFEQRQEYQTRQNLMDDSVPVQPLIRPIRQSETAKGLVSIFV